MTTIVGFSGSLRQGSYNAALLRAAQAAVPAGVALSILSIRTFPLYNADDGAAHGIPPDVARMKEAIAAADCLLIATPEHNNGIPGVTKNAIDWLSRPPADVPRVLGGKPVALIGASSGPFGTILSQDAWLPVLRALRAKLWTGGRLLIPNAGRVFDASGNLTSDAIRDQVRQLIAGFSELVRARAR